MEPQPNSFKGFTRDVPDELELRAYAAHKYVLTKGAEPILDPLEDDVHDLVKPSRNELKRMDPERYRRYRMAWLEMKENLLKMTNLEKRQAAFRLRAMINLDDEERALHKNEKETHLRKGQIPLHQKIAEHIGTKVTGPNDGYCVLPTGVGKTVLFSNIIEQMMRKQKAKVCIVVPSVPLLDQVRQEIRSRAPNIPVATVGGGNLQQINENGIQIVTYQSLKDINAKETYDLVILDETHTATSENRTEAVNGFTTALRIGFTATPEYSEEKNVEKLLGREIVNMSLIEAQREGMLAPFKVLHVQSEADLSELKQNQNGEYNDEDLEKALNTDVQNGAVVETHLKHFHANERFVAFCSTLKHCRALERKFKEKNFRVVVHTPVDLSRAGITGTEDEQNAEVSRKLNLHPDHADAIDGVISSRKLTAGWDEPIISVCYNVTPTSSKVDIVQKSGRALRLDPMNPNKIATVVDFIYKQNTTAKRVLFSDILLGTLHKELSTKNENGKNPSVEDLETALRSAIREYLDNDDSLIPPEVLAQIRVLTTTKKILEVGIGAQDRATEQLWERLVANHPWLPRYPNFTPYLLSSYNHHDEVESIRTELDEINTCIMEKKEMTTVQTCALLGISDVRSLKALLEYVNVVDQCQGVDSPQKSMDSTRISSEYLARIASVLTSEQWNSKALNINVISQAKNNIAQLYATSLRNIGTAAESDATKNTTRISTNLITYGKDSTNRVINLNQRQLVTLLKAYCTAGLTSNGDFISREAYVEFIALGRSIPNGWVQANSSPALSILLSDQTGDDLFKRKNGKKLNAFITMTPGMTIQKCLMPCIGADGKIVWYANRQLVSYFDETSQDKTQDAGLLGAFMKANAANKVLVDFPNIDLSLITSPTWTNEQKQATWSEFLQMVAAAEYSNAYVPIDTASKLLNLHVDVLHELIEYQNALLQTEGNTTLINAKFITIPIIKNIQELWNSLRNSHDAMTQRKITVLRRTLISDFAAELKKIGTSDESDRMKKILSIPIEFLALSTGVSHGSRCFNIDSRYLHSILSTYYPTDVPTDSIYISREKYLDFLKVMSSIPQNWTEVETKVVESYFASLRKYGGRATLGTYLKANPAIKLDQCLLPKRNSEGDLVWYESPDLKTYTKRIINATPIESPLTSESISQPKNYVPFSLLTRLLSEEQLDKKLTKRLKQFGLEYIEGREFALPVSQPVSTGTEKQEYFISPEEYKSGLLRLFHTSISIPGRGTKNNYYFSSYAKDVNVRIREKSLIHCIETFLKLSSQYTFRPPLDNVAASHVSMPAYDIHLIKFCDFVKPDPVKNFANMALLPTDITFDKLCVILANAVHTAKKANTIAEAKGQFYNAGYLTMLLNQPSYLNYINLKWTLKGTNRIPELHPVFGEDLVKVLEVHYLKQ